MSSEPRAIGSSLQDVDLAAITTRQKQKLLRPLYQQRLIVLKNQQLSDQHFVDFSRVVGRPEAYLQDCARHPLFPLIAVSSHSSDAAVPGDTTINANTWQSASSFEAEPKGVTMLMPRVLPEGGARTISFIDMAEVYAALPQATKDRLAGLRFVHSCGATSVTHPAVVVHPVSGEKILFVNRRFTTGVAGCPAGEGDGLLGELLDFAESAKFVRELRLEIGDIVIWDNRLLASKSAAAGDGDTQAPVLLRVTVRDNFVQAANPMALAA